jgi:hypothetical protein
MPSNYFPYHLRHSQTPGRPCAADGSFLPTPIPEPISDDPMDALSENPWAPFEDQVAFDFA